MNKVQTSDAQDISNMLSAEAKVFIPRQHTIADGVESNGVASPNPGGAANSFPPDGAVVQLSEMDQSGSSLSAMSQQPVNGVVQEVLPGYMTSCYPFVTGDTRLTGKGRGSLHMASPAQGFGPGMQRFPAPNANKNFVAGAWNQHSIQMMSGVQPQFNMTGGVAVANIPNGLQQMPNSLANVSLSNGLTSVRNNGLPNGLSTMSSGSTPSGVHNGMPFDGGTDLGDGLLPTPPMVMTQYSVPDPKSVIHMPQLMFSSDWSMQADYDAHETDVNGVSEDGMQWNQFQIWPNGEYSKRPDSEGHSPSSSHRPLNCQKICLRHASVQTDFPEQLANSTLEEVPNTLHGTHRRSLKQRNKNRMRHKGQGQSSDSDIDSDSGYSSTLHRKNQVSYGTNPSCQQPDVALNGGEQRVAMATGNHVTSMQNSVPLLIGSMYQQPSMSYAAAISHQVASQKPNTAIAMVTDCDKTGCDTSNNSNNIGSNKVNNNSVNNNKSVKMGVKCSTNSTFSNVTVNVASLLKDLECAQEQRDLQKADRRGAAVSQLGNTSVNVNGVHMFDPETGLAQVEEKKKRKRTRRRKKKSTDAGKETTTAGAHVDEEIDLHFEDEEEFPDLSASVSSNLQSSPNKSVMSYSDILKPKPVQPSPAVIEMVSHVVPPATAIPTHPEAAQSGANIVKESRTSRKRRKRRETANKAADAEMAEICLEQHMLELKMKQKQPLSAKKSVSPVRNSATQGPWKLASDRSPSSQPPSGTGKKVSLKLPATVAQEPIAAPVKQPSSAPKQAGILKATPQQYGGGKKSKQPIALDFSAMIDALEVKRETAAQPPAAKPWNPPVKKDEHKLSLNPLDTSAPSIRRGKERETPKLKKPSPLKKVILKEREEKKRLRLLDEDDPNEGTDLYQQPTFSTSPISAPVGIGVVDGESDLSQDAGSSRGSMEVGLGTPASAELSPISQNSPICMSPLSPGPSPLSSGVNSPIAGTLQVKLKIHSRRFREYCNQVLDKEIDTCCVNLLQDLVRFQDRQYHKDPVKAKARRRVVLGLREVTKHLKLRKIKCVIISPNLEKIQSKGGLDEALNIILDLCSEQEVPFMFALGRRALGRACAKLVPVSVVGVFNYEGSEENFKHLVDLTEKAREQYREMIQLIEKEMLEHPPRITTIGTNTITHQFPAHMGHSRTPSGCSVISFTSSILSEPISENYPYSEPETDSKGYEIVKKPEEKNKVNSNLVKEGNSNPSSYNSHNLFYDPGNEADDESGTDRLPKKVITPQVGNEDSNSDSDSNDDGEDSEFEDDDEGEEEEKVVENGGQVLPEMENGHIEDALSLEGSDTVNELPHIDSIHNIPHDMSMEILSQHSTRTLESLEVLSTHSSKTTHSSRTFGDGNSTVVGETSKSGLSDHVTKVEITTSISLKGAKTCEKDHRIQSWVNESTTQLQQLHIKEEVELENDLEHSHEDCVGLVSSA